MYLLLQMLNKGLNGTITPVCFVLMNSFVYTWYYKLAIFFFKHFSNISNIFFFLVGFEINLQDLA